MAEIIIICSLPFAVKRISVHPNEWQVIVYRSLNSRGYPIHLTLLHSWSKNPSSSLLLLHQGKLDQSGAWAAKFYHPPLFLFVHSFSTDDIVHLFPSNGVLSWLPSFKNHSAHKMRSYQSFSAPNSNKLAVTFSVHGFWSAAGLSVTFCFYT